MSKLRMTFNNIEVTEKGLLITGISIIDAVNGETLKVAELNSELAEFIEHIEIDIEHYFKIQKIIKTNPEVKNLIKSFNLFT